VVAFESGSKLSIIEDSVFCHCSSLKPICIPRSVTFIGANCFQGCGGLAKVTFPSDSKLSRIEEGAFRECQALTSICIPSSAEFRPEDVFKDCPRLLNASSSTDYDHRFEDS
jgi:hypothetical protein